MDQSSLNERPIPRRVLLGPYFVLSWLYKPLMPLMRKRWGTRFVILVPEGSTLEQEYRPFCGPDDVFVNAPELLAMIPRGKGQSLAIDPFDQARRNEDSYGIHYSIDIFQQERGIACNMVAGGA
ncbi:MAG: hypothetical protein ACREIP_17110, partial [Alphaproteobacteria bacterium]